MFLRGLGNLSLKGVSDILESDGLVGMASSGDERAEKGSQSLTSSAETAGEESPFLKKAKRSLLRSKGFVWMVFCTCSLMHPSLSPTFSPTPSLTLILSRMPPSLFASLFLSSVLCDNSPRLGPYSLHDPYN